MEITQFLFVFLPKKTKKKSEKLKKKKEMQSLTLYAVPPRTTAIIK